MHDLEKVVIRTKDILVFARDLFGMLGIAVAEGAGKFAAETAGQTNQPFGILPEDLFIHPRLVVVPFKVREGNELDEIFVSGVVLGKEGEVVADRIDA